MTLYETAPGRWRCDDLRLWDPCWGPGGSVYTLGAPREDVAFYMQDSGLYRIEGGQLEHVLLDLGDVRLCAGGFTSCGRFYVGSYSHDRRLESPPLMDQGVFVVDTRDWWFVRGTRLSASQPLSAYFGGVVHEGQRLYAFRDPTPFQGGYAVATGGCRWGTLGNICLLDAELRLTRKTLLSDSLRRCFGEIERPCFVSHRGELYMLFSGKAITPEGKRRLGEDAQAGFYPAVWRDDQFVLYPQGQVEAPPTAYGMGLRTDADGHWATYWVRDKDAFELVIPREPNLEFRRDRWVLT